MTITCHAEDTTTGEECVRPYGHAGNCLSANDNIVYA